MLETKEPVQIKRNLNLDLIRCVAVFCVLSVHSFIYVPFYAEHFIGKYMWILVCVRTFSMVCVPLFVLLTGYLCINRKLSKGYWKKLVPIMATYVLACILTVFIGVLQGQQFGFWEVVLGILDLNGGVIRYSWYMGMYLGLFLLIPFLNLIYHGLETKNQKHVLLVVLLVLTTLPSALNNRDYSNFATYFKIGQPQLQHVVLTPWWEQLWPVTYYFIGAYIREYDIPMPKGKNVLMFIGCVVLVATAQFYRSYEGYYLFKSDVWGAYDKLIHSVLLFLLLLHLDLTKTPRVIEKCIQKISKLSLGIYLCSYITDTLVYYRLLKYAETTREKQHMVPLLIAASFLFAMVLSQLIQWIMDAPKLLKRKAL